MSAQNSDRITKVRDGIRAVRTAMDDLRNLRKEITSQGGAAALLTQDQFDGANADLGATASADLAAAITSTQTIDDWMTAQFHWDVLYKVM